MDKDVAQAAPPVQKKKRKFQLPDSPTRRIPIKGKGKGKGKKKKTDEEKRLSKMNTWTFTRVVAVIMGMGEYVKTKVAEQKAVEPGLNEGPAAAQMILKKMKGPYNANKEGMNLLYDNAVKAFMEEGAPHLPHCGSAHSID